MKPSFHDLVEIDELQSLCETFTRLTGFVTAILDIEGNVLTATGWQEICTEFHRKNPETAEACRKSDTILGELPAPGEKYRVYRCKNGLIDVSVPIVVENQQIGRLYTGQFLFARPDMEFFRCQAARYGFDEASYLAALQKVPIVTEEQVAQVMEFLCRLAEMIGRMGVGNQRLREANGELLLHRQELERSVDERTAELSEKNEQLRREIAERRHAEERILASLSEKEVLLKEIHHRVKNNLQIISTLLDLQFEKIDDNLSLNALRESQDRIKAMALLHEKLYQSPDLASIDFAEYIEKLAHFLFNSHMADPERINLNIDAGHLPLEIDRAIPCGLIINELVSNALKHAFPGERSGAISIDISEDRDDRITLKVADTGVGIRTGLDFKNTETLGLQLVNMLARQLGGQVSMESASGTAFTIRFQRSRPA
jgi:two-component sensor histidine kinase/ligand-binding sensor protein